MRSVHSRLRWLFSQNEFRRRKFRTCRRLLMWRARCWARRAAKLKIGWDTSLILPAQWRGQSKLLYVLGMTDEHELRYVADRLGSGMVAIDVGAHIGLWTTVISSRVGPSGAVVALEPAEHAYQALLRNVACNRLSNVRTERCAASDVDGVVNLHYHPDPTRNSLGCYRDAPPSDCEPVPSRTLDSVLDSSALDRVDFVKIDVEGAEELVLRGASHLLGMRPVFVFEINASAAQALGLEPRGAWRTLEKHNYEFYQVTGPSALIRCQSVPHGGNVLAIPRPLPAWATAVA